MAKASGLADSTEDYPAYLVLGECVLLNFMNLEQFIAMSSQQRQRPLLALNKTLKLGPKMVTWGLHCPVSIGSSILLHIFEV